VSEGGRYAGKSVLVTGAEGFIGSWLTQRLLDEGAKVVALRRDVPPLSYFQVTGLGERCEIVQGELLDYESLMRIINEHQVSAVFHLAAQPIVGTANRSPLSTFETNVRGTYMLLEACRATGVVGDPVERVVVASSDKAYGSHEELPYREDLPLQPRYPYEVSKACADFIARSYADSFGLPVAVTRLANVYGGGDLNFSRIVPDTIRALVRGERPLIRSDGTPQRDFLYIEDAVDAYLAVADSLDRPELRGRAWNAGNGQPTSVLDLVRRLIEVAGRELEPEIQGEGTPAGEIDRQWLDSSSIREELGWAPQWELENGLAETYRWYERHLS
jgi:CDP-glucose 4,6-dehydratase